MFLNPSYVQRFQIKTILRTPGSTLSSTKIKKKNSLNPIIFNRKKETSSYTFLYFLFEFYCHQQFVLIKAKQREKPGKIGARIKQHTPGVFIITALSLAYRVIKFEKLLMLML